MERYFQIRKVRIWIFLKATFPNTLSLFNMIKFVLLKCQILWGIVPFAGLLLTLTRVLNEKNLCFDPCAHASIFKNLKTDF